MNKAQKALQAINDHPMLSDYEIAARAGVSKTVVQVVRAAVRRDPRVVARIQSGELATTTGVGYAAGLPSIVNRPDAKVVPTTDFRHGDKFNEAVTPLRRYLATWERRGFELPHVNPREARRRLDALSSLKQDIERMAEELERRAHTASLTHDRTFDNRKR